MFKTLRDAVILVALVVLLFLQNWRSAVIPLIAVPVAVIGTFAVMAAMGFSLNNLTLFGLVLAIGIVVDDAIVVVEAVQYHIEHGLAPREASIKAMSQVSGPVIAVGLVLGAVFVPCAFISGITGQFFRQFALTIAVSTLISAFNSLTLSPALAAVLLQPHEHNRQDEVLPRLAYVAMGGWAGYAWLVPWLAPVLEKTAAARCPARRGRADAVGLVDRRRTGRVAAAPLGWGLTRPLNRILGSSFRAFNVGFTHSTNVYTRLVGLSLRASVLVLVVYGGLLTLTYFGFTQAPAGFIPMQDKGYLLVNVQLPDAASVERTEGVMHRIEAIARDKAKPRRGAHGGRCRAIHPAGRQLAEFRRHVRDARRFPQPRRPRTLRRRHRRRGCRSSFRRRSRTAWSTCSGPRRSMVWARRADSRSSSRTTATTTPARPATGRPGRRRRGKLHARPARALLQLPRRHPLALPRHRPHAGEELGVSISDLFTTLQVYLASFYVNDFNRFGRTWQVNVQADANFRRQPEDLKLLKVRNDGRGHGPAGHAWPPSARRHRPGDGPTLQHVSRGGGQRRAGPGRQLRRGHPADAGRDRSGDSSIRMHTSWTELALLQLQTGTPPCTSSSWPSCWCSWCWPPSTKAGRCRWPSSSWCRCACCARSRAWSSRGWT